MKLPLRLALLLVSAGTTPLCFPPYGFFPLMLFSVLLLLVATEDMKPPHAFFLGLLHGTLSYGLTLYWFFNIFSLLGILLFAILGMFTALFCFFRSYLYRRSMPDFLNVVVITTLWTGIEFFRSELFFLRFPWATPGSALGPALVSPILGVYGASFSIVLAAASLTRRKTILVGLILCTTVLFLGSNRAKPVEPAEDTSISVTVVQSEKSQLSYYLALTRQEDPSECDLILWPEYALPYDVRKRPKEYEELLALCEEMDTILVVGTQTTGDNGKKDWRNTSLVLDQNGVLGEYYKARPVHFFDDGTPGENFDPIQTDIGHFGTPICFDCDYTAICRKMTDLGAEYFAVSSYDSESWSATQHLQHSVFFRMRAAENGRWLACAASSGVSQIIDPHGNVHESIPPMQEGIATHRIERRTKKTIYTRVGWLFPWGTLVISGILVLCAWKRKRMESKKRQIIEKLAT